MKKWNSTCFLVLFLSLVLAAVSVCGEDVLDAAGDPVQIGVPYYVLPAKAGTGGGLVPSSPDFNISNLCPLEVVQSPFPFIPGLPVTFSTLYPQLGYVQLSDSIEVQFDSSVWLCPQAKWWRVDPGRTINDLRVVSTGDRPSPLQAFRIVKAGDAYGITFCLGRAACVELGVVADNLGVRRLVVGGETLTVKFEKAYEVNSRFKKTMLRMFPFY